VIGLPSLQAMDARRNADLAGSEAMDMRCGVRPAGGAGASGDWVRTAEWHGFVVPLRRGERLKILMDRDGFVLWYKRLGKVIQAATAARGSAHSGIASGASLPVPGRIAVAKLKRVPRYDARRKREGQSSKRKISA